MNPQVLKRIALVVLILLAAGIAFWTSFRNAVDMASIVQTDADGILRVKVVSAPEEPTPLRLQIEYRHAEFRGADGRPIPLPFPEPFTALLVNEAKQVVARLGAPDADGMLPAVDFPRGERYLWLVFPKIYADGKPASLLICNPLYNE